MPTAIELRGCPKCTGGAGGFGRIRVNYLKIQSEFYDRGSIGPNIQDLAKESQDLAKKYCPVRTGKLRKSIKRRVMPPTVYQRDFILGAYIGYAPFVRKGTPFSAPGTGLIHAKNPTGFMELRPLPYSYFEADDEGRFRQVVQGQKPNDFLTKGLHEAVRGRFAALARARQARERARGARRG